MFIKKLLFFILEGSHKFCNFSIVRVFPLIFFVYGIPDQKNIETIIEDAVANQNVAERLQTNRIIFDRSQLLFVEDSDYDVSVENKR